MYDARCFSKQGDCQFEFCITYSRTPVVFAPSSPNIPFVFIINWTVRGETWAPGRIYLLRSKIILTHIISFEHSAVWIYKRRLTLWIGKKYNNFLPRNSCKNYSKEKHRERTCINLVQFNGMREVFQQGLAYVSTTIETSFWEYLPVTYTGRNDDLYSDNHQPKDVYYSPWQLASIAFPQP